MTRRLRFGLWYDFRNPPQWRQDPTRLYRAIFAQIERAEALGWDDVWLSEHHFIADGYTPSMLPLAVRDRRAHDARSRSARACCCCRCTTRCASPRTPRPSTSRRAGGFQLGARGRLPQGRVHRLRHSRARSAPRAWTRRCRSCAGCSRASA